MNPQHQGMCLLNLAGGSQTMVEMSGPGCRQGGGPGWRWFRCNGEGDIQAGRGMGLGKVGGKSPLLLRSPQSEGESGLEKDSDVEWAAGRLWVPGAGMGPSLGGRGTSKAEEAPTVLGEPRLLSALPVKHLRATQVLGAIPGSHRTCSTAEDTDVWEGRAGAKSPPSLHPSPAPVKSPGCGCSLYRRFHPG